MFKIETSVKGSGKVQALIRSFKELRRLDLRPLASILTKVAHEEKDRMARDGLGSDGIQLAEITAATRRRRVSIYGTSSGHPLHPRGLESAVRKDWSVTVSGGNGIISVRMKYTGEGARLASGHASGAFARGTVRDVRSLDEKGVQRIYDTAIQWARDAIFDKIVDDIVSARDDRRGTR